MSGVDDRVISFRRPLGESEGEGACRDNVAARRAEPLASHLSLKFRRFRPMIRKTRCDALGHVISMAILSLLPA